MKRNRRSYKSVGSFTLTQPKILVTDPGYEKDEWCSKLVKDCKVGLYDAYININGYKYKHDGSLYSDKRVASLFIKHSSIDKNIFGSIYWEETEDEDGVIRWYGDWKRLSDNIGVDSGQAGFFDYDKYGDNSQFEAMGKCEFGDKWYSNCCDATLSKPAGIVAQCGVNSSSGYGDGCYTVWGHYSKDKEIDAMVLFFLPDNEEEEI